MAAKIMEFDILLIYSNFDNVFFYPKSFALCPKIVLPLEYMVLAAICITFPGYDCIHGNKCPCSL